jgi:site-specific recombinase XerD
MIRQLSEALQALRHLRSARVFWREDGYAKLARPLLSKWLARGQHRAGLEDNGGLHIMRHTFCSHLAMQGVPVNAIKEFAGHQDLMTTMRYMHLSPWAKETAVLALEDREAVLARQRQAESTAANRRVRHDAIMQPIGCPKTEAEPS